MIVAIKTLIYHGQTILDQYKQSAFEHQDIWSWVHCRKAFLIYRNKGEILNDCEADNLALQLTAYLASWGMYRGSSFISKMDYRVHIRTVKILCNNKYSSLWGIYGILNCDLLNELYKEIEIHYIEQRRKADEKWNGGYISQTLITKILMGTFGCTIAFDIYACRALKELGISQSYNGKTMSEIFKFYKEGELEFNDLRMKYDKEFGVEHTQMKIIDTCLWGYGKELIIKDNEEKERKKNAKKTN